MRRISSTPSPHTLGNRLTRVAWALVWILFWRPSPKPFHGWRRFLLRAFGARIGDGAHIHPSTRIWAPWHLTMEDHSCLGPQVDCYCVGPVYLGAHSTVSQYSFLCTASHRHDLRSMPLVTAPIRVESKAWIAADAFIGPGVTIGEGAVVGARSVVVRSVAPWTIVAGHPARFIKTRIVKDL
jgi:putative colanic acid biosynthesis acetyltransferase WcaF